MEPVIFTETQQFSQWWMAAIYLLLVSVYLSVLIRTITHKDRKKRAAWPYLAGFLVLFLAVGWLLYHARLDTRCDASGIYIRFWPYHFSERAFLWEDVEKAYVRDYNAFLEYGGHGIRWFGFSDIAYTVAGDQALQLVLKNGDKVLIGTQKPAEIAKCFDQQP